MNNMKMIKNLSYCKTNTLIYSSDNYKFFSNINNILKKGVKSEKKLPKRTQ